MKRLGAIFFLMLGCLAAVADLLPPPKASQAQVNNGTPVNAYVSPDGLRNYTGFLTNGQSAAQVTNIFGGQMTNNLQPFRYVVNVRAAPYNAVGDGVHDDWTAIQTAITTACLATNGPTAVFVPSGIYRLTNGLALTTRSNTVVGIVGNSSITELFGDGAKRTVFNYTITNGNGLEFKVVTNDPRHLSNFTLHDLAFIGPGVSGTTNVWAQGIFMGYSPDLPYGGDTTGWGDTIRDCIVQGWSKAICVTNIVWLKVENCELTSNIVYGLYLAHCDTFVSTRNNYSASVARLTDPNIAQAGLAVERDLSGSAGQGGTSFRDEFGDYGVAVYVDGCQGGVSIEGGNCERAGSFLLSSNINNIAVRGMQLSGCTNYFHFKNGGATGFWADSCGINDTGVVFNQEPGSGIAVELPIRHALNGNGKTNGLFNGALRVYPPVNFQTPRWTHSYQLAETVNINCTALNPNTTSPSPYFSADGLGINNTTGELWLQIPSGLGNNANNFNLEMVRITALIQGGAGMTNGTVNLTTFSNRKDPNLGDVNENNLAFTITGLTNGMCKIYSWTNTWVSTSDTNPRYDRVHFQTTGQIYLIGLNAETIDY